jgi:glycosyltransferase involved in cell wall biosynthesis
MGGAEHLIVDLLPALKRLGNDVELLLINGEVTPFYRELQDAGIVIHHIQERGRIYSPIHVLKARNYIKSYDIIHTHTFPCQIMMAMAKALSSSRVYLVTTEHSTTNHRRDKPILKPMDKWMYRQYNRIICIAEQARKNLVDHIGCNERIEVINNGVDINKFYNPIKQSLHQVKVITMVASMRDAKDQDTIIRAMVGLGKDYRLLLVGDGPRREMLEQLTTSLGLQDRVSFWGNRSDVPSILRDSDIIVLSSHWEGLSLSSIEGMASGRPFIASDVPGLGNIVRNYGEVFPEGDSDSFSAIVRKLCSEMSYYTYIANCCQERAKQFDIRIMADKYNSIYQELIS